MVWGIIKSVLRSFELWLELKNRTMFRDLVRSHRKQEGELIEEIEALRSTGKSDDAERADFLRDELVAIRKSFNLMVDFYTNRQIEDKAQDSQK